MQFPKGLSLQKKSVFILCGWFILWIFILGLIYNNNYVINKITFFITGTFFYVIAIYGYLFYKKTLFADKFYLKAGFLIIVINYIALSAIISYHGWPQNHEALAFKSRMLVFVYHLNLGDIFPYWSSTKTDSGGLGSPLPLFYHKLFSYISAFWFILINHVKASIVLAIFSFNCIGIIGIYKIGRIFSCSRYSSLIVSFTILFLNYTITNWWVRGAMAEYSAMMLIPILIYWELKLIIHSKFSLLLPIILILLFLAHNVIAYYAIFSVIIAVTINIIKNFRNIYFMNIMLKILYSVTIFVLVLSVYFIPILLISDTYDLSQIKLDFFNPENQIKPIIQYLFDKNFSWISENQYNYTVELDHLMLLCLLSLFFFISYLKRKNNDLYFSLQNYKTSIFFLIVTFTFYFALQSDTFKGFYNILPGAAYIQFPWRLLSFLQFLLIILLFPLIRIIEKVEKTATILIFLLFVLFSFISNYPLFKNVAKNRITDKEIEDKKNLKYLVGIGEFIPNAVGITFWHKINNSQFYQSRNIEVINTDQCKISEIKTDQVEVLYTDFNVENLRDAAIVILPYHFSSLERVYLPEENNKPLSKFRTSFDTRIRLLLPKGKYLFRLRFPSILNLFYKNSNIEPIPSNEFNIVSCSAERKFIREKSYLISNCGRTLFEAGHLQDSSRARSGKFCVKATPDDMNAFWYVLRNYKKGQTCRATIWRYGDNGCLNAFSTYKVGNVTDISFEKDSLGWQKLQIKFLVGDEKDGNIIITGQNTRKDIPAYFDDISIELIN